MKRLIIWQIVITIITLAVFFITLQITGDKGKAIVVVVLAATTAVASAAAVVAFDGTIDFIVDTAASNDAGLGTAAMFGISAVCAFIFFAVAIAIALTSIVVGDVAAIVVLAATVAAVKVSGGAALLAIAKDLQIIKARAITACLIQFAVILTAMFVW